MLQTVFNSKQVFLVDNFWNGNSPFQATFSLIRDDQASLSQREARRPYSSTLRVTLKYDATVYGAALRKLQAALRALNTQPVIVPLWPAVTYWADRATAPISGGLKIVWKEALAGGQWSRFELFTDAPPGWPAADDLIAPALYGFLTPTQPAIRSTDAAVWSIEFTESSPPEYALAPAACPVVPGPQPAGYPFAPALFPFQPDFSAVTEEISVEVKHDTAGFAREHVETFYPHAAARIQKATYTLAADQIGGLLRFFRDVAGPGSVFWAPGWMQIASLSQDAAPEDSVLTVEDTAGVNVGDYVSLFADSGTIARRITDKTEDTITLDSPAVVPVMASSSLLLPLCLARLSKPVLSVSWKSPASASCEIQWTEVPAEYVPAADETIGATLGRLPTRIILFDFTRDLGNGSIVANRFTNFEGNVTWGGNDYLYRKGLSHGDITQTLNFENGGTDLTSFLFAGNPVALDVALKSETPLWLTIRHADFDGVTVSNAEVVFTGQLESVARTGQKFSPKFNFGPASLDDQLPRMIRGPMCNHIAGPNPNGSFLISYGCGLLRAQWDFIARIAGPISGAYPYSLNLSNLTRANGPVPNYFLDWFALGWMEVGDGPAIQRRMILKSSNPVAGTLSIILQRGLEPLPQVGDIVHLFPGCDGMFHTCKAYDAATNTQGKFGNPDNFGGEPFCPIGNPSLTRLASRPAQGAKK